MKPARRVLILSAAVGILAGAFVPRSAAPAGDIEESLGVMRSIRAADLFETTRILSSAEMEGRLAGSPGYDRAARWAAARFKEWGLEPLFPDYLQPFLVQYNETGGSAFALIIPPAEAGVKPEIRDLVPYSDFCPPLYSGFGEVEAEVVFAGYGITAPELDWDDYRDLDAGGKIIALLHGVPGVPGKDFSPYLAREHRLLNAKRHGAAGLILILSPVISGAGVYVEGLPMVMTGDRQVEPVFSRKGYDLRTLRALARDGRQGGFPTGVTARLKTSGTHHARMKTHNVAAFVKGSDPKLSSECLLLGAHLDGIGRWPVLLPGANDNASGSAVVLALGRAFAQLKNKPKRSLVFALFSAEELGLLGSRHLARNLPPVFHPPQGMVNFDVVGAGDSLHVSGGKTYPPLFSVLDEVNKQYAILANLTAGEISAVGGNSDYAPFLEAGIPAYANWVRGGRAPGHSPQDSIYAITPQIMEDITRLYFLALYRYADR